VKILVLSTCYPKRSQPNHGIFIHRQIQALAALGVECHVIQPVDWSPPAPIDRLHPHWRQARIDLKDRLRSVEGIPVHHPPVYHPRPSRFFPGDYWDRVGHAVARFVARRKALRSADLIYAHFLCHEGYVGLIVKRKLGLPLVAIARGDDVHAWPERWPDRNPKLAAVLGEADGLLACSRGLARDAARWATSGLATPFEVVYNGIDTGVFSPATSPNEKLEARCRLGLPVKKRLLLSVGTTIVAKGWLDLLDAFAAPGQRARDWDIVMAGSRRSDNDLDLMAEAGKRGLQGRAHWLGCLPPEKMADLYRAVDLFALASHNEGLSNSMLEAMASALPVVVTDVGGHSDIVEDRVTGWLVPPRDVTGLTAALCEAMTDDEMAVKMAAGARERAIETGDYRKNARKLLRYFENVLSNGRVASAVAALEY
jgi:glycosyltransferase involved in cell wall biosynthesis